MWQGSWALFAPNPDRTNSWIEADVELADGSHRSWSTPDWQELGWADRIFLGRHVKLSNNLRLDRYRRAWPELARYIVGRVRAREGDPAALHITLTRRWWNVPSPERYASELAQYGELPPPRAQYPHRFVFYERGWP